MIGDIHKGPDGTEYEVVWNGGEGLVGDRDTKMSIIWTPPSFHRPDKPHDPRNPMSAEQIRHTKRAYHKTHPEYWKRYEKPIPVDKADDDLFNVKPMNLE